MNYIIDELEEIIKKGKSELIRRGQENNKANLHVFVENTMGE